MMDQFIPTIGGAGGKGGRSRTPKEAPNTLRSKQVARVIDLLGEGPIRGIVKGQKGIFLDGVALQDEGGETNFENFSFQQSLGYPNQPIMSGFPSSQQEIPVGVELTYDDPIIRSIMNTDIDRCRVTVSVPSLQSINKKNGDTNGTTVEFVIDVDNNSGGFKRIGKYTITGKTTSRYQRQVVFSLPRPGPWEIKVNRITADSTVQTLMNELFWDSYTEITDDRINYANSALVGIQIDAEQFSSIPKRTYLVDGLLCRIPANYNPYNHTYTGIWNGTFKMDWTDNPAWVFYDIVTNNRYGLGQYISAALIDKYALYTIAQYCDQLVPNGHGGYERRYSCNAVINSQMEAFDLLAQMAGCFHGFTYWNGNKLIPVADMPATPRSNFNNANVINGVFNYSGSDIRNRHTVAAVAWNDPKRLGEVRVSSVEDKAAISRFGIQKIDLPAIGCISEGQALRTGAWAVYAEQYEGENVVFSTSFEGVYVVPGMIIQIADINVSGMQWGGRIVSATTTQVVADRAVPASGSSTHMLSVVMPNGTVESRQVAIRNNPTMALMAQPFSAAPLPDTPWVVSASSAETTQWRVLSIKQTEANIYEINAVRHLPSKYDYIEKDRPLIIPDVSNITIFPPPVVNVKVIEYMVQTSPISVGVRGTLSWSSKAASFDVNYRPVTGNWIRIRSDNQALDFEATEGLWEFQIIPVGPTGMKGKTAYLSYDFIGRFALPPAPRQFRINVVEGVAMFDWLPITELDVVIGGHFELRHTATLSGATWLSAQTVIPSIPGTATSCETGYLAGTWFLRTFDITGRASETWASIVGFQDDSRYFQWHRICEHPLFLGSKDNTELRAPQDWLVIQDIDSGMVDEQEDPIDDWPEIDYLEPADDIPAATNAGSYLFNELIDAGAPFSVRLSADILAFPFTDDTFFDMRMDESDVWQNWDDESADYGGQIQLMLRSTNDDPALVETEWSPWENFLAGEHYGRAFQFMAVLTAPPGQNIGIENLCVMGDFKSKFDEGNDVPYPAEDTTVFFRVKFYNVPAVVITLQEAHPDDHIHIIVKTREYFTLRVTNAAGAQQVKTFDWHAQGY